MQYKHRGVDGYSWGRASRLIRTLVAFFAGLLPLAAWAAKSVPDCRLDDELEAPVRIAAQWGLEGLKAAGRPLNFDTVSINPRGPVPARTLRIEVVKDATLKTVDAKGCIKPVQYIMEGATLRSDGPCQATRLKDCNAADRDYMRQRYEQIAGIGTGDTQTGYEKSGACYMTNQQACIHHQRMALLDALGPRDALSVKGACVANAAGPVHIRCSAGALKMLRNSESVEYKATTIAMVLVIGHELGHLLASESSSFEVGDNTVDLQWSPENKMARLDGLCTSGESRRERERAADEVGLSLARQRLPLVEFWRPAGRDQLSKLRKNGLTSGRVWWSFPQQCPATVPTHGMMAKDSRTTDAGRLPSKFRNTLTGQALDQHTVAFNLATRSTQEFLRWAGKTHPQIEKHCGATLKHIVQSDRRGND